MTNLKHKFFIWLYKKSRALLKNSHLNKHKNDIKCPVCNEWFSLSGIYYNHSQKNTIFGIKATCGQCKSVSHWNLEVAPVAILCDEEGAPLND